MILENKSTAMITINTTPYISKREALEKVKSGDNLEYSRINIPPTESRDIPDEFCDCDFVQNLLKTGELIARSEMKAKSAKEEKEPAKAKPEPVKPMTAKEKKEFETLVIDAEIEGVDVSGCTTLKEVKAAMKKAGK